jgi:hypothetical protein
MSTGTTVAPLRPASRLGGCAIKYLVGPWWWLISGWGTYGRRVCSMPVERLPPHYTGGGQRGSVAILRLCVGRVANPSRIILEASSVVEYVRMWHRVRVPIYEHETVAALSVCVCVCVFEGRRPFQALSVRVCLRARDRCST